MQRASRESLPQGWTLFTPPAGLRPRKILSVTAARTLKPRMQSLIIIGVGPWNFKISRTEIRRPYKRNTGALRRFAPNNMSGSKLHGIVSGIYSHKSVKNIEQEDFRIKFYCFLVYLYG